MKREAGQEQDSTVELVNPCSRMMDLLDAPRDVSFFGKLMQREIIYRLLQGSQGARVRAIATLDRSRRIFELNTVRLLVAYFLPSAQSDPRTC